jgi:tyrosyl-tRNA synthetase
MHVLDLLKERGLLAQITFEEDLYKRLEREETTFYVGFDPTADSLHIGHYIPIIAMAHLQRAGHRPIALMGGGTAMVGDPSGRTDLRSMLTVENIDANIQAIQRQMARFLDFGPGKAILANNGDWLRSLSYLPFLRDVGVHFSVNRMLTAECYKQRMEKGLTFLEFNYMIMQAYDFLELYRRHGCRLQVGGDDQWSNILAGADLIRRKEQEDAFAITCKLLLTAEGAKMGKTAKGALWLDAEKVTPYEFFQYWRNVDDAEVAGCLGMLTFLPMEEVRRLAALPGSEINDAKTTLAFEITALVHGQAAAEQAREAAASLFGGGGSLDTAPTTQVPRAQLEADGRLTTLLALCGLASSRGEARKLVQAGAVFAGEEKVSDIDRVLTAQDFPAGGLLLKKGKKGYHRLLLTE